MTLIRVVALCVVSFLIMLSYSIARPATESLFIEAHTASQLPFVWLLVAIGVTITVAGYARLMARVELLRLFGTTAAASGLILAGLLAARYLRIPFVDYALYVWKDIYIVLLVETFYSYANAVFPIRKARWFYGLFGVVSALGSVTGNLAVGALAHRFGTSASLWAIIPVTIALWLMCIPFSRLIGVRGSREDNSAPDFTTAMKLVRKSSYLLILVVLIAVVQVVVNLIDYEFNHVVEGAFPNTDDRTAVIGQVYAVTNLATIALHALTGPVLRLLGVPLVLLIVPCLLGIGLATFAVSPRFLTVAIVKVASKCFDYTIFRAAKEMLYIPLSYAEKTQGKSIIDVLTYRLAKGGASLVLLLLQRITLVFLVTPLSMVLVAVWFGLTVVVARRFRARVSRKDEMGHGRS